MERAAERSPAQYSEYSLAGESSGNEGGTRPAAAAESDNSRPDISFEDSESDLMIDGRNMTEYLLGPTWIFNYVAMPAAGTNMPSSSSNRSDYLPDIPPTSPLPPRYVNQSAHGSSYIDVSTWPNSNFTFNNLSFLFQ